jgi:hypothetical protein
MTVRTLDLRATPVPRCWQRRRNVLHRTREARVPEPTQLYSLIVLALYRHAPLPAGGCAACGATWPCEPVRLACRLREGF